MPNPTSAQHAQVLIDAYRAELRRLYGEVKAREARLSFGHERVNVHIGLLAKRVTVARFTRMLKALRSRQPAEGLTDA